MKRFLVIASVTIFMISTNNAHADESIKDISVEIQESIEPFNVNKIESVKYKRGTVSGYGYPVPSYGLHYQKQSPYTRFPGVHKSLSGTYSLTPGAASVQSYSIIYPRAHYSKPVLTPVVQPRVVYHSYPRTYYPTVYANRYPFIPKPAPFVPTPTFAAAPIPSIVPQSHAHIHPVIATNPFVVQPQFTSNVLPAPAFPHPQIPTSISQNGWRPVIQSAPVPQFPVYPQAPIPQKPIVPQVPQVNRPSISALPPLAASGSGNTPNVNSLYLPPGHTGSTHINEHIYSNDELAQSDELLYYRQQQQQHQHQQQQEQQQQQDLQAHLQQLEQNDNYLLSQDNEGTVVPLSEQGYETASNDGRYSGLSSYDVPLNHRGRLARRSV